MWRLLSVRVVMISHHANQGCNMWFEAVIRMHHIISPDDALVRHVCTFPLLRRRHAASSATAQEDKDENDEDEDDEEYDADAYADDSPACHDT